MKTDNLLWDCCVRALRPPFQASSLPATGGTHDLRVDRHLAGFRNPVPKLSTRFLERSSTELDPGTVAALSKYVEIAQHAPARTIRLGQRPCVFVYTDASLSWSWRRPVRATGD